MDQKGMKMSKSLGNTIDPLKVMESYGADIIRLWALSVDFTEDHRIGDEILKGVADQYRKLRNSFRYLLGALDGFDETERVTDVNAMPELERYVLHRLAEIDYKLRQAVSDYDFNSYVRVLSDFANNDLSAFFFDIRKDCLYCDAPTNPKRRAYRTVLDILFHALIRWVAPVIVFTAEEVWQTRYPEADSVHLLEWPSLPLRYTSEGWRLPKDADTSRPWGDELLKKWDRIRGTRLLATEDIEPMRRDKIIGSSLEVEYTYAGNPGDPDEPGYVDLAEIFIFAAVHQGEQAAAVKTSNPKCGRCWRHLPEVAEDGALCGRCAGVVNG
jgi:isoleucyl-tRNA synthetase